MILAERGIVKLAHEDGEGADALAAEALEILRVGEFDDYMTSAIVYAFAARTAARRGDIVAATRWVDRAERLRPLLTYVLPAVSGQALLELARAFIAVGDPSNAQSALRQLRDIFVQRPDLGCLVDDAEHLQGQIEHARFDIAGAASLTPAERRLVPLLPTHLTFSEIAARPNLSRNTVKSQAISIYRKLGVTSRGAAIERLGDLAIHKRSHT